MGILRTDRVSGLGGANAIKGSVFFGTVGSATYGNQIEIQKDSELDIGNGNLTVECWFNSPQISGYQSILGQEFYNNFTSNKVSFNFYLNSDGIYLWNRESGSAEQKFGVTGLWVASTWNHVAWVREGTGSNENKIYLNGSLVGSAFTNNVTYSSEQKYHIGGNFYSQTAYGQYPYKGHISNLRMSNIARYTANFTPPTSEFTVDSNTILLTCQSPSNILKEETGKTLSHNTPENNTPAQASRFTPNSPVGFSTTTDVGGQYGSTFDGFGNFSTSTYMVPPGGNTRERGRGRGVVGGGWSPSVLAQIYSVEIASDGTSADFGDLTLQRRGTGAAASHTRGVWAGGYAPGYQDRIDFVTIASEGNAIDFGNLDTGRFESSGVGNDTRGVFGPCENPATTQNVIQFITFATTGDATDFGDSTISTGTKKQASMCSTTRGIFAGGQNVPSPSNYYDLIEYITTATTGNATDFGDLTENVFMCSGVSDSTRGIRAGGATSPSNNNTNTIDYVTIASTGNASDFGDLTADNQRSGGMSNRTRGLFSGGATPNSSTAVNSIDKITIQTQGNATDFGDYPAYTGSGLSPATQAAGCSDSHGGLS